MTMPDARFLIPQHLPQAIARPNQPMVSQPVLQHGTSIGDVKTPCLLQRVNHLPRKSQTRSRSRMRIKRRRVVKVKQRRKPRPRLNTTGNLRQSPRHSLPPLFATTRIPPRLPSAQRLAPFVQVMSDPHLYRHVNNLRHSRHQTQAHEQSTFTMVPPGVNLFFQHPWLPGRSFPRQRLRPCCSHRRNPVKRNHVRVSSQNLSENEARLVTPKPRQTCYTSRRPPKPRCPPESTVSLVHLEICWPEAAHS